MGAVKTGTGEGILGGAAVGERAYNMQGRAPQGIEVIRPLREGVIADFEIAEAMIRYFIRDVHGRRHFVRPRLVIAIPYGTNAVQRRAFIDSAERAGARAVYLVEEPIAAGPGAGLNGTGSEGSSVVDLGGGTRECAGLGLACLGVPADLWGGRSTSGRGTETGS